MTKTVIFDFDGTLADCKELHQAGFRAAVQKYSPGFVFSNEEVEGRPTREKIRILNSRGAALNAEKVNEHKQAHTQQNIINYIKFDKRLVEAISYLKLGKGYKVCLASNATETFIDRSLDIMQIKHLFDKINTATDYPAKPDTTTFIDCMRYTDSTKENTYIFEDSEIGIQCARSTGANVIEVTDVEDTIRKIYTL